MGGWIIVGATVYYYYKSNDEIAEEYFLKNVSVQDGQKFRRFFS